MSQQPLCFILMPFGVKPDPLGGPDLDFDEIYEQALKPGVQDAGMFPIRADEDRTGGIIHKPMFERLLLCEFAVADLTTANANVFYELGVRHAARPRTTLTIFATQKPLPFDVAYLRTLPYELGPQNSFEGGEAAALRGAVTGQLVQLRQLAVEEAAVDSPLFQLLTAWQPGDVEVLRPGSFFQQLRYNEEIQERLTDIRAKGRTSQGRADAREELAAFYRELPAVDALETGVLVSLMESYRALDDWDAMIGLYQKMPKVLQQQVVVRQQLAFAYNRRAGAAGAAADQNRACAILDDLIAQHGPNSETWGLVGRVHKDAWQAARRDDPQAAPAHLAEAIAAYRHGFEADWSDPYPGINLVTLLEIEGSRAALREKGRLLPVVRYGAAQRLTRKSSDYWDHATMLELAALDRRPAEARRYLSSTLAFVRESWEPRSTAANLGLIEEARMARSADVAWLTPIRQALEERGRL